jgi:hypothetical protein
MNTISLSLPESLHKRVKELADKDRVSIDQFVISAIAEKIAAFMAEDYLEERAKRGSKQKFEQALAKVPDVEPEEYDKL